MKKRLLFLFTLILISLVETTRLSAGDYCHNLLDKVYATFTVQQCDSLIKANVGNPNFMILDVRTPGEYLPKHIEGAINRNTGDSDFNEQLKRLDKNKTILLHCQSGGRSATAFASMKTLGFREVYNMQGGMNSWNSASLPSTVGFAPKLGIYECAFQLADTIPQGEKDTISIKITNSANDTLRVSVINFTGGNYFSHPAQSGFNLIGGDSQTIQLIFSPVGIISDSLTINFQSNGGNKEIKLKRSSANVSGIQEIVSDRMELYPVPAQERVFIKNFISAEPTNYRILNLDGKLINEGRLLSNSIDLSGLKKGLYFVQIQTGGKIFSMKMVKN